MVDAKSKPQPIKNIYIPDMMSETRGDSHECQGVQFSWKTTKREHAPGTCFDSHEIKMIL